MAVDRVKDLGQWVFKDGPCHLPWILYVRAPSTSFDVLSHKGGLERLSPEECPHAVLLALAGRMRAADFDDEEAVRWRTCLLSATYCFEVVHTEDDLYWRAQSLRQAASADYVAIRRTAIQSCFELALGRRMQQEAKGHHLSPKEVAAAFLEKGRRVKGDGEEFTVNFVESALRVYETLLQDPMVMGVLNRFEGRYNLQSGLNSVTKLDEIRKKCLDSDLRRWIFEGLWDMVEDKKLPNSDLSKPVLCGGAHSVGLCSVLTTKRKILLHLLNQEMPKNGFSHDDLTTLRLYLDCHAVYRQRVQAFHGGPPADVTWIGKMRESSVLCLRIVEDMVCRLFLLTCRLFLLTPPQARGSGPEKPKIRAWGQPQNRIRIRAWGQPQNRMHGGVDIKRHARCFDQFVSTRGLLWRAPQELVYLNSMDSLVKPMAMKTHFVPEELHEYQAFKDRWDQACNKLAEERVAENAAAAAAASSGPTELEGAEAADDPLKTANPSRYKDNSPEYWDAFGAQFVRQYVQLHVEPETAQRLAAIIGSSNLSTVKGVEGKSSVLVLYDIDLEAEALNRPQDRKPPHNDECYKKLVQGAMLGRGGQLNKDNECTRRR